VTEEEQLLDVRTLGTLRADGGEAQVALFAGEKAQMEQ